MDRVEHSLGTDLALAVDAVAELFRSVAVTRSVIVFLGLCEQQASTGKFYAERKYLHSAC